MIGDTKLTLLCLLDAAMTKKLQSFSTFFKSPSPTLPGWEEKTYRGLSPSPIGEGRGGAHKPFCVIMMVKSVN